MEANKDEAIKVRKIAEKNIKLNAFVATQKFILKVEQFFPVLEGVTEMLVMIDVHIIAQNKIMATTIKEMGFGAKSNDTLASYQISPTWMPLFGMATLLESMTRNTKSSKRTQV